ncbi:MAG: hypothetical protein KAH04_03920 [Psychrilyobacter sp.]|nr:hypothetical protein [Psychrilyobacter sp.]
MKLENTITIVRNNFFEKSSVFLTDVPYVIVGATNLIHDLYNINIENKN